MTQENEVLIRPATGADVEAIHALIMGLAEYEGLVHTVKATPQILRRDLFGPRPLARALLAQAGGQPVGLALYYTTYSTFAARPGVFLEDLFVVPDWRGRGVGRALIRQVARLASNSGCGRMEWTVLDWNRRAIGFYERMGARVLPDWRLARLEGEALVQLAAGVQAPNDSQAQHQPTEL